MRRALPAFLGFLLVTPAQAQSLPSKKEATVLLQKAIDTAHLKADGAPFHMVVKIRYELYGKSSDGMYELLWASADRFREEFRLDPVGETDVAVGEKRYVLRDSPALLLALTHFRAHLNSPLGFLDGPQLHVSKVYSTRLGGEAEICVKEDDIPFQKEACFDPASSGIVSAKLVLENDKSEFAWSADDFVALGPKRYPRHQVYHLQGEILEAKVEKLEEVSQFAENVFVPPPGAIIFDWCPKPIQQGKLNPPSSPIHFENLAYYVLVGRDGLVVKSIPLVVPNQQTEQLISRWLQKAKFPIQVCQGKPTEYERIFEEHPPIWTAPR